MHRYLDGGTLASPLGQKPFKPKAEDETDMFFGKKVFAEGSRGTAA